MEVKQIYELVNSVTQEVLGKSDIIAEDLSNVVDVGTEIFNANAVDNYVKSLVNHIGKVIFVNRPYAGKVPSVLMDAWEFGSVCEKISSDIPEASENETWELEDGKSYSQDVFYKPTVSAKFFNSKVTFEVDRSFTERQVKESFSNAAQMNGFMSMLYNAVDKSMTIKVDSLIMRTINSMTAQTFNADSSNFTTAGDYTSGATNKCVNLLYLYNQKYSTDLTAEEAILNPDFIRFASYTMGVYVERIASISTLFNVGAKERFTDAANRHMVMLADFEKAASAYLYSNTYHDSMVTLPEHETVPYWQGSGTKYGFSDISSIDVTIPSGSTTAEIKVSGILAVLFDRDALGVSNLDRRVTTSYNAKAEFFNNYYKFDAGYFTDTNENFVVFYVA